MCLQKSLKTAVNEYGGSGVRILLEVNGDLDSSGHFEAGEGGTLIHQILQAGYDNSELATEMVQILLDFGASPHIPDYSGATAIELAPDLATALRTTTDSELFNLLWGHEKKFRLLDTPVESIRKILLFMSGTRDE